MQLHKKVVVVQEIKRSNKNRQRKKRIKQNEFELLNFPVDQSFEATRCLELLSFFLSVELYSSAFGMKRNEKFAAAGTSWADKLKKKAKRRISWPEIQIVNLPSFRVSWILAGSIECIHLYSYIISSKQRGLYSGERLFLFRISC